MVEVEGEVDSMSQPSHITRDVRVGNCEEIPQALLFNDGDVQ